MNLRPLFRRLGLVIGSFVAALLSPEVCAQTGGGAGAGGAINAGNIANIINNLPPGTNVGNLINNLPAGTNIGNIADIINNLPPNLNLGNLANIGGIGNLGASSSPGTPTIVAATGVLTGESAQAAAIIPGQSIAALGAGGQPDPTNPTTYEWTIAGGKITSGTNTAAVTFVADTPGIVTLSVHVVTGGTFYDASTTVTAISPALAGTIAAPATAATGAATFTASVPPASSGDRTFVWTVSGDASITRGQRTDTITIRPGTPGLKEISCAVTLQRLATVNVRTFLFVTGSGPTVNVTVNGGSGGGTWSGGSRIDVFANPPPAGQVFDKWIGDTNAFTPVGATPETARLLARIAHQVVTVPNNAIALTATYKPASAWTPTTVANFNPQTQSNAAGAAGTGSTTLTYYIPPAAQGLVFLLHETGGQAGDWFTSPEQILLGRDLVAAGYGVAALSSLNRTTGAWVATPALAGNLDALNHAAALDKFARDGVLAANRPVFFLGLAEGGNAGVAFAEMLAAATPVRPVKGAVLYCAAGTEAQAVTSKLPQFFALAANDENLGAAGNAAARANSQLMAGRGLVTGVVSNAPSPVLPGRFLALGGSGTPFTTTDAQAIHAALKTAGLLDSNNYLKAIPISDALRAALPAAYQARTGDVAAELGVAYAARQFFSDANARVIDFLNHRVADTPAPAPGRLVNLSTRTVIAFLGDTFALGFNISGPDRATLLIRGIGPALTGFGLSTALTNPRLEVNSGSTVIAANEGWDRSGTDAAQIAAAAASVGAFALRPGSADTAVLLTLAPGAYTVNLSGLNGATGDVLAEVYDVSKNNTRLTNLSTLAKINNPGDLLIPGIVVAGANPRTLLIRAVGPGLQDFGLESYLGDPRITVLNGTATVDTNNNWAQIGVAAQQAALTAVFPAVGAFPLKVTSSDAALVTALAPAAYTLQAGAAPVGAQQVAPPAPTGSVLVEVYEVP
jgi:hypothetical protein